MGGSKARTWVVGTVLVAVLMAIAGWFLLISPTLESASEIRDQVEQTDQQNDLLKLQTAKLKADYENLPALQAELAAAQQQIPSTEAIQTFLREVDSLATAHAVQVVSVTPSSAVAYASAATASTQTDSSSGSTATATESADASTTSSSSTTTTSTAPSGLLQVPVSVAVKGSWSDTTAFLAELQATGPRLLSVDSVQTTAASGEDSSGLQTLTVSGSVYVLPDSTTESTPEASSTAAPVLPEMAPGANPLSPSN